MPGLRKKNLKYAIHLQRHMKNVHHNLGKKACNICNKEVGNLKTHIMAVHRTEEDREYKCLQCTYSTIGNSKLKQHVNEVHTKEHYFNCTNCEYKTPRKGRLLEHIKRIHEKSMEKDQKCPYCDYSCSDTSYIKKTYKCNAFQNQRLFLPIM